MRGNYSRERTSLKLTIFETDLSPNHYDQAWSGSTLVSLGSRTMLEYEHVIVPPLPFSIMSISMQSRRLLALTELSLKACESFII